MELDGQYKDEHGECYYHGTVKLTPEMDAQLKVIREKEQEIKDLRLDLDHVVKNKIKSMLPEKWEVKELEYSLYQTYFKARCYGLQIAYQEYKEKPLKEVDPYERIRTGGNMIQILSNGVLTKEEKRRVLGLPIEKEIIVNPIGTTFIGGKK